MQIRSPETDVLHGDGRTDMTKLIVAFRNFEKSALKRSKAEKTREKRNYTWKCCIV